MYTTLFTSSPKTSLYKIQYPQNNVSLLKEYKIPCSIYSYTEAVLSYGSIYLKTHYLKSISDENHLLEYFHVRLRRVVFVR
jgi:hypothetical protein